MKKIYVLLAVVLMAVTACAGTPAVQPVSLVPSLPSMPSTTVTRPSTSATTPQDQHGFIPKQMGQQAGLSSASDHSLVTTSFSVDRIRVDPICTSGRGANAHAVVLDIRVATTALDPGEGSDLAGMFNYSSFELIGPDGVTHAATFDSCIGATEQPSLYTSNSKYVFSIDLGSSIVPAQVVLLMPVDVSGNNGWIWNI
jgi:hypothetical protein